MADEFDDVDIGEEHREEEEEALPEKPKKIFINHVDSYHGKHIARVSTNKIEIKLLFNDRT
jgi:hypothetical protein